MIDEGQRTANPVQSEGRQSPVTSKKKRPPSEITDAESSSSSKRNKRIDPNDDKPEVRNDRTKASIEEDGHDVVDETDDDSELDRCRLPEGDGRETLNVKYWDAHFAQDADYEIQTEYLMSFYAIEPLISEYLTEQKEERILIPGCGNCNFSAMLYDAGWENLVSTDISPVAIDIMKGMSEVAGRTKMLWEVDDAMSMKYGDNSFDMVIDKSLLDCMYHVKETRYLSAIERFLHECCRVTKVGGICIFITARSNVDTCRFLGVADIELEQGTGTSEKDFGLPLPWKVLVRTCVVECDPDTGAVPIEAEGFFLDSAEANMLLQEDCGKVFFLYVCEKTEEYDVTKIGSFVHPAPVRRDDDTDSVHEVPQLQHMTAEACSLHGSESDGKDDRDDDYYGGDDKETSCIDGNGEPGAEAERGALEAGGC